MASSGKSDEVLPHLRYRRPGTKPGFLCVVPFLLEEKNITRINKDTCSKKEIERLKGEGFGPPPDDYLNSDGKAEFSLTLSVDEFKGNLVEIYPKLANRPFFLMKANKSNDLEHLDIEPSSYSPNDIYQSNLGHGKLYIRIGRIEDFEETIPRPKKKPRRDEAINPGSFPVYRAIQPKPPSTVLMSTNLSNAVQTSTISLPKRDTGIFPTTPVVSSGSTLSVATSSKMLTTNAVLIPRSTTRNESTSRIGVSGESVGVALPSVDFSNVTTRDFLRGQQQEQQQQRQLLLQQVQNTHASPPVTHQLQGQQQQQQQQQEQEQQQNTQYQVPSLQTGPILERYLSKPTVNMAIPTSSLSRNNNFVLPANHSVLTSLLSPFNYFQNSMPGTSREMELTPSELASASRNSNIVPYSLQDNNRQYRENPSPLNILAETMLQNGPMQLMDNADLELDGMEFSDNTVLQPLTASAQCIPEPFDIESFVKGCRETGHLTVSKIVIQKQEVLECVRQESLTIHSLTIEPPCQAKEVYEMFQPPSTLESLKIKGNIFDDENTECLLVNFVFKLNNLVKLDLSNSTFLSDMHFTFLSSLGRLKKLKSLCLTNNKLRTVGAEALAVAMTSLSNLEVLNLSKNCLADEGVEKISEKIGKLLNLEVLELSLNSITTTGVSLLFRQISGLVHLKKLDLSSNFIDDDFLENVDTEHLKFLINLQDLLLNSNKMTWLGVSRLCSLLLCCKSLQSFELSSNFIGSSVFSLAGTGKSFRLLTSLGLANAGIHGQAIHGVRALLENVKKLEVLDLSNNKLTSNDFELLEKPIGNMISLKVLNISNNATCGSIWQILERIFTKTVYLEILKCERVALVGDLFSICCPKFSLLQSLKKLALGRNSINSNSMKALNVELESLTSLEEIDLKENYIGGEGFEKFCESLKCLSLLKINVARNYIGDAGAKTLAKVLPSLHCLEDLDLSENYVNGDSIRELCSGLVSLKHLKKLNLDHNNIGCRLEDANSFANHLLSLYRLEELRLGYCNIGEGDIETLCSNSTSLMYLKIFDISGNNIGHKGTKALADLLPSLHFLEELCLRWCRISGDDIGKLFTSFASLKYLKKLSISENYIDERGNKDLTNVLPALHLLEELSFFQCHISDYNVETGYISGLRYLKYLKILVLSSCDISHRSAKTLGGILPLLGYLEELYLKDCGFGEDDIEILCSALRSLVCLKILDISGNHIGRRGTKALAKVLPSLHFLEELRLLGCHIGHDVIEILFSSLASLKYLKKLCITYNNIGQKGTKALANVLPSLHFLEELDLCHCDIGEDDVETLCSGLRYLKYLKKFDFNCNKLGHGGTEALASVLPSLQFLEKLCLRSCGIDEGEILFPSLASLKYLKEIILSGNNIGHRGTKALTDLLQSFYFLEHLGLYKCGICESDFEMLFSRLASLKYLKKLWIGENNIGHRGTKALADVLPSLHFLEELDLCNCNIDGDDIKILCSVLSSTKYLKIFGISSISYGAAENLAKLLPSMRFLQQLELGACGFFADRFELLCGGLRFLTSLKRLHISANDIGHRGARALANLLPLFFYLEDLSLIYCGFNENDIEILCSALSSLKNVKQLNAMEVDHLFMADELMDKEALADLIREDED